MLRSALGCDGREKNQGWLELQKIDLLELVLAEMDLDWGSVIRIKTVLRWGIK